MWNKAEKFGCSHSICAGLHMWRLIEAGDFRVDPEAFYVSVRNRRVHLTPREFKLLLCLAKHSTRVVTHQKLILAIWGGNGAGDRERLRVLVQQVRRKIEALAAPEYIVTEPWIGYRFEPAGISPSGQMQQEEILARS
jgi:two-component system KDP operon response regulator KdpE